MSLPSVGPLADHSTVWDLQALDSQCSGSVTPPRLSLTAASKSVVGSLLLAAQPKRSITNLHGSRPRARPPQAPAWRPRSCGPSGLDQELLTESRHGCGKSQAGCTTVGGQTHPVPWQSATRALQVTKAWPSAMDTRPEMDGSESRKRPF